MESFVEDKKAWWEQWFVSIQPWEPYDIDEERFVWIRIPGVPCHVWGEKLFAVLAETQGTYVKCDEETLLKTRMDEAKVCLRTKRMDLLDETFKINIEGKLFTVKIMEDKFLINVKIQAFRHSRDSEMELFSLSEEESPTDEEYDGGSSEKEDEKCEDGSDELQGGRKLGVEEGIGESQNPSSKRGFSQPITKKLVFDFNENGNGEGIEADKHNSINTDLGSGDMSRVRESIYQPSVSSPTKVDNNYRVVGQAEICFLDQQRVIYVNAQQKNVVPSISVVGQGEDGC